MKINKILAVDFDGTITKDNDYPHCGEIMPGAVEYLTLLHNHGCTIILWTCRAGAALDDAVAYCKLHKIPIDYVNEDCTAVREAWFGHSFSPKVFANYYIDDLNIYGFPGWYEVYDTIYMDAVREAEQRKGAV